MPEHAPLEYKDRTVLWNAVEKIERYKTAQLAREVEIALPAEFTREQNIFLAREYVQKHFVGKGMCADLCVHDKGDGKPHFHVMLTMRPLEKDGAWGHKSHSVNSRKIPTIDWNEHTKAEEWRKAWADMLNNHLERHGFDVRVDHRSYARQGVDIIPSIKMGVAASHMERRGICTEKGNRNREIDAINKEIRQTKARLRKVKEWLYAQPIQNAPSFIDVMSRVSDAKNLDSRWKKIANLQTQAQILIFLQENDITDMGHFVAKVTQMNEGLKDVSDKIKAADRRLETLSLHLTHCENRKQYKAVYDKYKALTPDKVDSGSILEMLTKKQQAAADKQAAKQEAFYAKHSVEIEAFKEAEAYLKTVLNGRTQIPIGTWQAEHEKLFGERFVLAENFYGIKDEIKSAEMLRRGIEELIRGEVHRPARQQIKSQGVDL